MTVLLNISRTYFVDLKICKVVNEALCKKQSLVNILETDESNSVK